MISPIWSVKLPHLQAFAMLLQKRKKELTIGNISVGQ